MKRTEFDEFLIAFILSWVIGPAIMGAVYYAFIWLTIHGYFGS